MLPETVIQKQERLNPPLELLFGLVLEVIICSYISHIVASVLSGKGTTVLVSSFQ